MRVDYLVGVASGEPERKAARALFLVEIGLGDASFQRDDVASVKGADVIGVDPKLSLIGIDDPDQRDAGASHSCDFGLDVFDAALHVNADAVVKE